MDPRTSPKVEVRNMTKFVVPDAKASSHQPDDNNASTTSERVETGLPCWICTHCTALFFSFDDFSTHSLLCRGDERRECTRCGMCFANLAELDNHSLVHTTERRHQGVTLLKHFTAVENVTSPVIAHIRDKQPKCGECGQGFARRNDVEQHLLHVHGNRNLYECTQCEMAFGLLHTFERHLLVHATDRPLNECAQSGKSFARVDGLRTHGCLRILKGAHQSTECSESLMYALPLTAYSVRPKERNLHQCTVCSKCFAYASQLTRHLLVHTGEKPYHCTQCMKSLKSPWTLKQHMLIHLGLKPYQCTRCGRSFRQRQGLRTHARVAHVQEELRRSPPTAPGPFPPLRQWSEKRKCIPHPSITT